MVPRYDRSEIPVEYDAVPCGVRELDVTAQRPGGGGGGGCGALLRAFGCGPRGCLGIVAAVVILVVVGNGLDILSRAVFDPWALPMTGRPTLLGDWTGTLRTASGMHFGVALHLDYRAIDWTQTRGRSRSTRRDNLEGRGVICNRHGERIDYRIFGDTNDRDGTSSYLDLSSVETGITSHGWGFDARWDGERLLLSGTSSFHLDGRPTGGRPSLAVIDPVVGELRHAPFDNLARICATLAAEGF